MARLSDRRRCIAPDFLGLGYTETRPGQDLAPRAQADMIVAVLDALSFDAVDSVANNSGGAVAQLLTARYPKRVRTLLLTNCDVHTNSPPKAMAPELEAARKGTLANLLARQIRDKAFARSAEGLGGQYVLAFEPNPLPAIEPALKACAVPVRMVWGTGDRYFDPSWADWLDRTLPRSRGVRRVQGAKLFFPEEMPELIAEEESALWEVRP
jgi:haloalkane dehalogenase